MRHGMSEMNKLGLFSGRSDTPLAPEGVEQCKLEARKLKGVKVDVIVSSPMRRAIDSARTVAKEIGFPEENIILSDLFMERDLGSLEGSNYIHFRDMNVFEGVEHSKDLIVRTKEAYAFLNKLDADTVLVVSHSATGRALTHVINPSKKFSQISGFRNAEIVKLI